MVLIIIKVTTVRSRDQC